MDVCDWVLLLFEELRNAVRSRSGVVTSNGYEQLDVVLHEEVEVEILSEVLVRGLETAHGEERSTSVEDVVCQHEVDVGRFGRWVEEP